MTDQTKTRHSQRIVAKIRHNALAEELKSQYQATLLALYPAEHEFRKGEKVQFTVGGKTVVGKVGGFDPVWRCYTVWFDGDWGLTTSLYADEMTLVEELDDRDDSSGA